MALLFVFERRELSMFNSKRYMTNGVLQKIPVEIQILAWTMIDELKNKVETVDYLQVFELVAKCDSTGKSELLIKHSQEQPPYKAEVTINCGTITKEKIYVIDDQTHSTMLLASEY